MSVSLLIFTKHCYTVPIMIQPQILTLGPFAEGDILGFDRLPACLAVYMIRHID